MVDGILIKGEVLESMYQSAFRKVQIELTVSLNFFPRPYLRGHIRSSRNATLKTLTYGPEL